MNKKIKALQEELAETADYYTYYSEVVRLYRKFLIKHWKKIFLLWEAIDNVGKAQVIEELFEAEL